MKLLAFFLLVINLFCWGKKDFFVDEAYIFLKNAIDSHKGYFQITGNNGDEDLYLILDKKRVTESQLKSHLRKFLPSYEKVVIDDREYITVSICSAEDIASSVPTNNLRIDIIEENLRMRKESQSEFDGESAAFQAGHFASALKRIISGLKLK